MPTTQSRAATGSALVGFIGLGQMGSGMAGTLAASGVPLLIYDINAAAVAAVQAKGAASASSIAEIAQQCEVVIICLPGEDNVEDVVFGQSGLLANSKQLRTIVDASTLSAARAREFEEGVKRTSDIGYCDCPVSGLPKRALDGSLTLMFGGSKQSFDSVLPLLSIMGEQILHCGDIGSGQMMKAVNNIIYNVNIAAFCEVLPLAVKAGLDPLVLETLLTSGSSRSFASEHFVPRILDRKFDGDFPMQAAYKDILNIRDIASQLDAKLPVVAAMVESYDDAISAGHGSEPKSAMIKNAESNLGVTVERPVEDQR